FQAEDGIRDGHVTGVQTCALPISCITGAVGGALVMQGARARWSTEAVASMSAALLGATIVATAMVHVLGGLVIVMLVGGAAWILFISLVSALVQSLAPDWVRARVLAVFMLISQGGMAAGSAVWGSVGA